MVVQSSSPSRHPPKHGPRARPRPIRHRPHHAARHLLERLHDIRLYAHLRNLSGRPWYVAAIVSWGIALFEYLLQVPANRIGYTELSLAQLKILQEVITLGVFVPFAVFYMRQPLRWDYVWAGLCIVGAVYFMFRGGAGGHVG